MSAAEGGGPPSQPHPAARGLPSPQGRCPSVVSQPHPILERALTLRYAQRVPLWTPLLVHHRLAANRTPKLRNARKENVLTPKEGAQASEYAPQMSMKRLQTRAKCPIIFI